MACRSCATSPDCPADELYPYTLTGNSVFPFIIFCPSGSNCAGATSVSVICCDQTLTAQLSTSLTESERQVVMQTLLGQCQFLIDGCDPGGGGGGTDTPVVNWYLNAARTSTRECSDNQGGGTYTYTIPAGSFLATSPTAANSLASQAAVSGASSNAFCLNAPGLCPCCNVDSSFNIGIIGGHGPFTLTVTSGGPPTGMTLTVSGGIIRFRGTAVTPGTYSARLKVTDSVTGYLTRDISMSVLQIGYALTTNGSFTIPSVLSSDDILLVDASNCTIGDVAQLATVTSGVTVTEWGRFTIMNVVGNIVTLKNLTGTPGATIPSGAKFYEKLTTLPEFTQGDAYSFQVPGSGGSGNYAFKITSGSLPAGLTMSSTGLISGTPTGVSDADFDLEMIDTSCQAIDRSFFVPQARIVPTSTRTIATWLGYPEFSGFGSTPPKTYKKKTWTGQSTISYIDNQINIGDPIGEATYEWSGAGEINDAGTQLTNWTKKFYAQCQAAPLGPFVVSVNHFGLQTAQGYCRVADPNSCPVCSGTTLISETSNGDDRDFITRPISFSPFSTTVGLQPVSSTYAERISSIAGVSQFLSWDGITLLNVHTTYDRNYNATLSDEYTDAIALSNAVVNVSNSIQAYSYPRTTGFQSRWQAVAYQIKLSNLVFGESYLVSIDFVSDLGVTTTRTTVITATGSTATVSDNAPVPPNGHSLIVQNARAAYNT